MQFLSSAFFQRKEEKEKNERKEKEKAESGGAEETNGKRNKRK
jgi:hypothetical protein